MWKRNASTECIKEKNFRDWNSTTSIDNVRGSWFFLCFFPVFFRPLSSCLWYTYGPLNSFILLNLTFLSFDLPFCRWFFLVVVFFFLLKFLCRCTLQNITHKIYWIVSHQINVWYYDSCLQIYSKSNELFELATIMEYLWYYSWFIGQCMECDVWNFSVRKTLQFRNVYEDILIFVWKVPKKDRLNFFRFTSFHSFVQAMLN